MQVNAQYFQLPNSFSEKLSPNQVSEFKEHVRTTGMPESSHFISNSPTSDLDGAEILTEFQIDRKKRPNLDLAPCPICSPFSPKYLNGYLVWFPNERVTRAIGRECRRTVSNKWDRAQRAFKIKKQNEAREKYLEAKLWRLPQLIADGESVLGVCNSHYKIWKSFRVECPAVVQGLRTHLSSGRLTVSEKRTEKSGQGMKTSTGSTMYTEVFIGLASGQTVVKAKFDHHKKLAKKLETAKVFDFGSDQGEVFLKICDMNKAEQIATEKVIKETEKILSKSAGYMEDFRLFFQAENISLLNKWASHANSALKLHFDITPTKKTLKITSREFGFSQISIVGL